MVFTAGGGGQGKGEGVEGGPAGRGSERADKGMRMRLVLFIVYEIDPCISLFIVYEIGHCISLFIVLSSGQD